jgi:hypothetical protein
VPISVTGKRCDEPVSYEPRIHNWAATAVMDEVDVGRVEPVAVADNLGANGVAKIPMFEPLIATVPL